MGRLFILKVCFYKENDAVYFSHLDLLRLIQRALRRTNLPIVYTQGFNPHPRISFGNALKLGKEGEVEAKFYFEEEVQPDEFKTVFSEQLPRGLKIKEVSSVNS